MQERCGHVEAAAVHIKIREGECAGVPESAAKHLQQQIGVFGVGVVIPAKSIVTERQPRDNRNGRKYGHSDIVASLFDRTPRRRFEGRCRDG